MPTVYDIGSILSDGFLQELGRLIGGRRFAKAAIDFTIGLKYLSSLGNIAFNLPEPVLRPRGSMNSPRIDKIAIFCAARTGITKLSLCIPTSQVRVVPSSITCISVSVMGLPSSMRQI